MKDLCCLYHRIISCIQTFLIYSQEDMPPTFRYCLWVARGLYPDYIVPSLLEQTPKLLED